MTLEEWRGTNNVIELGRALGFSNPKQIYRYLDDPKTGKPRRIPSPEIIAKICVLTQMKVQPKDWYGVYLNEAVAEFLTTQTKTKRGARQ